MATIIGGGLESHLHRQAREKALNILAEARDQAGQIAAQADRAIEAIWADNRAQTKATIAERRRRALAKARLDAQQLISRAQEETMQEVWRQVTERLQALTVQQRRQVLGQLVRDAARQLEGGDLIVQCNDQDRDILADVLPDAVAELEREIGVVSLHLDGEPASIWGGVIVRQRDGRAMVDNTLSERLAVARRELRSELYHLLSERT